MEKETGLEKEEMVRRGETALLKVGELERALQEMEKKEHNARSASESLKRDLEHARRMGEERKSTISGLRGALRNAKEERTLIQGERKRAEVEARTIALRLKEVGDVCGNRIAALEKRHEQATDSLRTKHQGDVRKQELVTVELQEQLKTYRKEIEVLSLRVATVRDEQENATSVHGSCASFVEDPVDVETKAALQRLVMFP